MSTQTASQLGGNPPSTLSTIGRPVQFMAGPLVGRTVRAELVELQKADVGRKSSSDRRPIDPPPIARLRLFDVREAHAAGPSGRGRHSEQELVNLYEADTSGFTCHVDLFFVPRPADEASLPAPSASIQSYSQPFPSVPVGAGSAYDGQSYTYPMPLSHPAQSQIASTSSATSISDIRSGLQDQEDPHTVVAHVNGVSVTSSSLCTNLIAGTAVATSAVLDYQSTKQVIFVFPDLAVKDEGLFFLRYRVFNALFQVAGPTPIPVLAECIGGPFRVYSTKNFPGLRASTDLTKLVSHLGLRVTSREHERKRRKSSHAEGSSTAVHTGRRDLRPIIPHTGTGTGAGASTYPGPSEGPRLPDAQK